MRFHEIILILICGLIAITGLGGAAFFIFWKPGDHKNNDPLLATVQHKIESVTQKPAGH